MRIPTGGRPVEELGEFDLIEQLGRVLSPKAGSPVTLGIGDDAALWQPRPGRQQVATTDLLVEYVDFRLEWLEWEDLGYKALAVNLSDLAAMGAWPRLALVSLGLRGIERDREIIELYRGMDELARRERVDIAGGDVSKSDTVFISVTAIGDVPLNQRVLTRSGAHVGDVLAVTGPLGLAAAGLRVMQQSIPWVDGSPAMRRAQLRPVPRLREGRLLARLGASAAMDLSDGLLGDLPKLCAASDVSALVDAVRLPIPSAVRWAFPDWLDLALRGGEDFELLFTAPRDVYVKIERAFPRRGLRPPVRIGEIVPRGSDGPEVLLKQPSGVTEAAMPGAFTHFGTG
ncbi:MAG TPA: thiamine-phosphate kinase [Thermomicrobiaceae bacterium]|nr:thiamine-phosphate kinase [Thermomicrobiaceae bacterium]